MISSDYMLPPARELLFIFAVIMLILHYSLVFLSNKLEINDKYVKYSQDLAKYVIVAWIGSIIGGSEII